MFFIARISYSRNNNNASAHTHCLPGMGPDCSFKGPVISPHNARCGGNRGGNGACELGSLSDIPSHAMLDRRTIIWLWDRDPAKRSVAGFSFPTPDGARREYIFGTEAYVRHQVSDARAPS